ncbi:MAG: amidase [Nitrospinota bacterium]|nr:amidase [Nitrospinota bacterium]
MQKITNFSAFHIVSSIKKKEISAIEVSEAFLERCKSIGEKLNTWIALDEETILNRANEIDKLLKDGKDPGPLCGVPIGIKDLIDMENFPTTSGSLIEKDSFANSDSTIVSKLKNAGANIFGKLNLHEFAFGPTGLNPHYGDQKNPWDPKHMTGGSSGGSGNSVVTSQVPISIGSDTGGSIRIPSSLCGSFGLKPTLGLVSKFRCMPLSWSLDTLGPLSMSIEDCSLFMSVVSGFDPQDPYSIHSDHIDFNGKLKKNDLQKTRVGHARSFYEKNTDKVISSRINEIAQQISKLGVEVIEIDIPELDIAYDACTSIMVSEAAAVHEKRIRHFASKYDPQVIERIKPGFFVPATSYIQSQRFRGEWSQKITNEIFAKVDAILAPTTPIAAPLRSEHSVFLNGEKKETRGLLISLTRIWNFYGGPSVSMPIGKTEQGLPFGAQLMGRILEDDKLLGLAYNLEKEKICEAERISEL